MSYFKSANELQLNKKITIAGSEAQHILKSRRISVGEQIELQDHEGKRFLTEVVMCNKDSLTVLPIKIIDLPPESPFKITLFQAVVKEKSLDNILQKTTELGVAVINVWNSRYASEKILPKFKYKLTRWQKIVDEACKQSDRTTAPTLSLLAGLADVTKSGTELDCLLVLDKSGNENLVVRDPDGSSDPEREKIKNPKSVGLVIGPEGGLDKLEIEALKELPNVKIIKFGPRILRADTAAIAAVAIVNNLFGDLN